MDETNSGHRPGIYQIFIILYALFFLGLPSCSPLSNHKNHSYREVANKQLSEEVARSLEDKFHLIFDIDWTLVVPLNEKQKKLASAHPNLITVFEESYLLKEGARDVLKRAFANNDFVISFFSGGKKERNDELLKQIKFTDGTTAYDHAYKILSKTDLTVLSEDQSIRFSQRYKKDISKISPKIQNALLIEDIEHFALSPGEKQTLWLGKTYFPKLPGKSWRESNEAWRRTGVEERFLAPDEGASWWNQRKLFYLEGLLSTYDSPEDIIAAAQKYNFSEDLAPDNWQEVFGAQSSYRNFLLNRPCDQLIPL